MLPETLEVLREHGFLRGDQTDTDKLADSLCGLLTAKPVGSNNLEEIQEKAIIVSELRYQLFGAAADDDVEEDLDGLLQRLLGGTGRVQDALENGYVLCAASVTRKLSQNGGEETIPIKRRGRFVTDNAEVIEQYFLSPQSVRVRKAAAGLHHKLELSIRRQPQLTGRRREIVAATHEGVQLELPVSTGPQA